MFAGMAYCEFAANASVVDNSTEEVRLGDSGVTSHITNNIYGLNNNKSCDVKVIVSTGEMTTEKFIGDIDMLSGSGEKFRLENVLYVPSVQKNLSTNRLTNKGATMYTDGEKCKLRKGNTLSLFQWYVIVIEACTT